MNNHISQSSLTGINFRRRLAVFMFPDDANPGKKEIGTMIFYTILASVCFILPYLYVLTRFFNSITHPSLLLKVCLAFGLFAAMIYFPISLTLMPLYFWRDKRFKKITNKAMEDKLDEHTYAAQMLRYPSLITSTNIRQMSYRLIRQGYLNHYLALQQNARKYHLGNYDTTELSLQDYESNGREMNSCEPDTIHSRRAYNWQDFLSVNKASQKVCDVLKISLMLVKDNQYRQHLAKNQVIYGKFLHDMLSENNLSDSSLIYQVWFEFSCLKDSWNILSKFHLKEKLEETLLTNGNSNSNEMDDEQNELVVIHKI
jgi:hypothetical protein